MMGWWDSLKVSMDTFSWYRPEGKTDAENKRHGWIKRGEKHERMDKVRDRETDSTGDGETSHGRGDK